MERARRLAYLTARSAFVLSFAAVCLLAGAVDALAISRDEVLSRAQQRVESPVRYSQSAYYRGYRTDCSGYVSMCWKTGTSWSTRSFHLVTSPIRTSDLKPGDALLKPGYHIRLFYGWLDEERTRYLAYESGYGTVAVGRIHSIADDLSFGYKPVRYDRISDSPAPRNLLKNPAMSVWARAWRDAPLQPMWWDVPAPWGSTFAVRRGFAYRSGRWALELRNPSADTGSVVTMAQAVPVRPNTAYRLGVWARTASDPSAVALSLTYLDGAGDTIEETSTAGDRARLNDLGFRHMSLLTTSPATAARARVTISLAGRERVDASGTVTAGTSVLLDDASLVRPQLAATTAVSRSTAYNGTRVTVRGTSSPAASVGATATIYVRRPGSATYVPFARRAVTASGSGGAWSAGYRFTRSMPRGTYRFRAVLPAVPGHLGTTTSSVTVRLR